MELGQLGSRLEKRLNLHARVNSKQVKDLHVKRTYIKAVPEKINKSLITLKRKFLLITKTQVNK